MTFGWQGFCLEHPEDWSPISLTGHRRAGYARLQGPGEGWLQVRWEPAKGPPTEPGVNRYLDRLAADSKRAGVPFERHVTAGSGIAYSYKGAQSGVGLLFAPSEDSRTFLVEASSSDDLKHALEGFEVAGEEKERWSLLGLDVSLPIGLNLNKTELKAGSTRLTLAASGVTIVAERWGFAEQLLAKRSLADWTAALSGVRGDEVKDSGGRAELVKHRGIMTPVYLLAAVEAERNSISVVRAETRHDRWRPQWDWLN